MNKKYEEAILREIDETNKVYYEHSVLGGYTEWSEVTGLFIPVTKIKRKKVILTTSKKEWWAKYGERAREYARQNHLPGPNLQEVAPQVTPDLVEYKFLVTEEDSEEKEIRQLIIEQILGRLLKEGRCEKHPDYDLYKRWW